MLLLLTVALLAGPTCKAQSVLGNNFGDYFYVQGGDQGELKGIRIFLSLLKFIKGIQLQFGNSWSDVYGCWSPENEEFFLEDGEYVTKVNGSANLCMTSLSFITNKGRVATFGVRSGRSFDDSGGSNKHLENVDGTHTPGLCITGMGFKWKDNAKDLMFTEPPRKPVGSSDTSKEKKDKDKGKDNKDDDGADDDDDDDNDDDDDDDDDNDDEEDKQGE